MCCRADGASVVGRKSEMRALAEVEERKGIEDESKRSAMSVECRRSTHRAWCNVYWHEARQRRAAVQQNL